MGKKKCNRNASFYRERAEELRELQKALETQFNGKTMNLAPLQVAVKDLEKIADGDKDEDEWKCNITNLIIPFGDVRNVEPAEIDARISISCMFKTTIDAWNNAKCDPFNTYSFMLRVFGEYDGVEYSWGLYIDKSPTTGTVEEWHPLYHLHCFESRANGVTILIDNEKKKGTMHLNVPRLVHYPLDIMLGIGFCLTNFYKKEMFTKFCGKSGSQFVRYYKQSQERILKPFFESLANNRDSVYNVKDLCPQIV